VTAPEIAVVVPTRNAARTLGPCLEALRGLGEIIVVDAESDDGTPAIAASLGARVITSRERSPARQRNEGIAASAACWILCIDADEYVGPALRNEIAARVADPGAHAGFFIRRATWYLGKRIRHSGWREDRVLRLFLRGRGVWRDEAVHEGVALSGTAGTLTHPMEHRSYESLEDVIEKLNRYSSWGAREILRRSHRAGPWQILVHPPARFVKTFILKGGFLDGMHGAVLASFSAYGVFLRYAKAWEMQLGAGPAGAGEARHTATGAPVGRS
jgi:glycosyltransferase involved in cell wall biosynthesis